MRAIIPKKIKGFRDIDPQLNKLRWKIINAASEVYKLYGFEHWDTPILEYAECLGKYLPETDTIEDGIYSFINQEREPVYDHSGKRLQDEWGRFVMENYHIALRYDLTAPLARTYAEKLWTNYLKGQLKPEKTPLFRRYQFGPVFRYEAKLDPGRFREFWQLDFDSVGTASIAADAEVCMVLADALERVGLKRGTYIVKVNNRKILKGFLFSLGIIDETQEQSILRTVDKVDKIGIHGLEDELGKGRLDSSGASIEGLKLDNTLISSLINFLDTFNNVESRKNVLTHLKNEVRHNDIFNQGVEELEKIDKFLTELNFDEERVIFTPTLVRGMSYYTGPVFEVASTQTYRDEKGNERSVGSICGGGRYDDLVSKLLGVKVPATGASIGVDRLSELLLQTKQLELGTTGPVLIVNFDDKLMSEYQKISKEFRQQNIPTEIYYGTNKGLKNQLSYADQNNCPIAVLLGEDEMKKGVVTVRNLRLGSEMSKEITGKENWKEKIQFEVQRDQLIPHIQNNM